MLQQNNTKHIEKTYFRDKFESTSLKLKKPVTRKKKCFNENAAIEMLYERK